MQGKSDSLRFTIQFSRNDPRHLQAAKILNLKGQRSKASYLTEAILHYESCGQSSDASGVDLTSLIESIVFSILGRQPPHSPDVRSTEKTVPNQSSGAVNVCSLETDIIEKAKRELGDSGIKSISSAMNRLRQK